MVFLVSEVVSVLDSQTVRNRRLPSRQRVSASTERSSALVQGFCAAFDTQCVRSRRVYSAIRDTVFAGSKTLFDASREPMRFDKWLIPKGVPSEAVDTRRRGRDGRGRRGPGRDAQYEVQTTMERRKFVVGLGSLAAGGAAAMGTGAVSQFSSGNRSIGVEVVGDQSAYVALQRPEDGLSDDGDTRNGNFVEFSDGSNPKLKLDFTSDNPTSSRSGDPEEGNSLGGEGVNPRSTYYFDGTFEIRNLSNNSGSGVGELDIWIDESIDGITFYEQKGTNNRTPLDSSNKTDISPGSALSVGVKIVADDLPEDTTDETFVVNAEELDN